MKSVRLISGSALAAGVLATSVVLAADAAPAAARPAAAPANDSPNAAPSAVVPSAPAIPKAAVPVRAYVTHKKWQQKKGWWCVPASVQLSLRTFGIKVTQDTLARKMKTSKEQGGTRGKDAMSVYNAYIGKKGYKSAWGGTKDPAGLMNRIAYDVGVLRKAVPLGVWGKDAPWIKSKTNFGHVVSVRGYDKTKGTVRIWDPSKQSYGGHVTVSVRALSKAAQRNGLFYVTKSSAA